jgi:hypothetical protein
MNSYIVELFGFEDFEGMRLTFAQKAKILPQSGSAVAWVRPGIIQLNTIRNKYGHKLDHKVDFEAISSIMEVLAVSREGLEFSTPIDAVETFASVACTFLTHQPQHLAEAFKTAFSYVHLVTPTGS